MGGPQTQWHQVKMGGLQSKVMSFIPCIGVLEYFLLESASVQTVSVSVIPSTIKLLNALLS